MGNKRVSTRWSRFVRFLKHKWNSFLYWLMFMNIDDKK